jgi:glycolate oxidase FAD binding subunit
VRNPGTAEELADELRRSSLHDRTIVLESGGSKHALGGPPEGDDTISLAGLRRVIEYEPRDLTVSVEAGMPWRELTALLAGNRQMVPLDPPFADRATVGGVIAANSSGPRRRLYGSARDMVIGMRFAMVDGKVVETGGMVVKNVAGLDMAKLLIGSLGTLAAIVSVNFKVQPVPELERTFVLPFASVAEALAARGAILTSALQPSAVDLLNPAAGATVGNGAWLLAVRAGGNAATVNRYERELARGGQTVAFEGAGQAQLWRHIEDFTPAWLEKHPDGVVVRASCTLKEVGPVMESFPGPAIARAASGVCYGYFAHGDEALRWQAKAPAPPSIIEFAPPEWKRTAELWPRPGGDLEIMRRVKKLFDPGNVLNRGRLYGRI